jgi:integrase
VSGSGGGVRQRADGRREGRHQVNGKRASVFGRTKAECQVALRKAMSDSDNGIRRPDQRTTVSTYLDSWLASVQPNIKPATYVSYAGTANRYLRPELGSIKLVKLQPEDVGRMIARLSAPERKLSPTTVRYCLTVLRIALGRAVETGAAVRNVAKIAKGPRRVKYEIPRLSREQARAVLDATADDRLGPLFAVAIATGARQGELLALRWSDVDLDARTMTILKTLRAGERAETKTESSCRTIVIPAMAVDALRDQRQRQRLDRLRAGRRWQDGGDFVFASRLGTPLNGVKITHALHVALDRAGLPQMRFHDLRHIAATLMLEAGVPLITVSRGLGHAKIHTTADVYGRVTTAMQEDSAARMDEILSRRSV